MVRCSQCEEDEQFCIYCQQRFTSTGRLHRHIHTKHAETIRATRCDPQGDARMAC